MPLVEDKALLQLVEPQSSSSLTIGQILSDTPLTSRHVIEPVDSFSKSRSVRTAFAFRFCIALFIAQFPPIVS